MDNIIDYEKNSNSYKFNNSVKKDDIPTIEEISKVLVWLIETRNLLQSDPSQDDLYLQKILNLFNTNKETCQLLYHNINYKKCSKCEKLIHIYTSNIKFCPSCGLKVEK